MSEFLKWGDYEASVGYEAGQSQKNKIQGDVGIFAAYEVQAGCQEHYKSE